MMIIDAHVYCLPQRLRKINPKLLLSERKIINAIYEHPEGEYALELAAPEAISTSMKTNHIDKSVLVSFPWGNHDLCCENNHYLFEIVKNNSQFFWIASVQPCNKDWMKEAERCINLGAIGLKINPFWQNFNLDGPETIQLIEWLIPQKNVFLMTHIDQAYKQTTTLPSHLLNFVCKYPNAKILAAHMGGGLGIYALHPPLAKTIKNIWFDTAVSATLKMIRFYVEAGLENRIIFGSDFPFNHSHSQGQVLNGISSLELSPETEVKIFKNNFYSLINLN